jgi:hypothetical protein
LEEVSKKFYTQGEIMKKGLLAIALTLLFTVVLFGCDTTTTAEPAAVEFAVDGEFTAYSLTVSSNKPQVTMVTVTIANGEITGFNLDCRQGSRTVSTTLNNNKTPDDATDDYYPYVFAWNEFTKKELGFGYMMHKSAYATAAGIETSAVTLEGYTAWMNLPATTQLEWFEQANLLEALWLADGVNAAQVNADGDFTNVSGVSVSNGGYTALAKQAVELARQGKVQAFVCSGTDFYFATMIVNEKGEVSELILNTIQGTKDTKAGTFVWKSYSKQELGLNYGMHYSTYKATLADPLTATLEGYQTWMTANGKLEWFQQANIITDYILENGWNANLKPIAEDAGVSLDGVTAIEGTAGVTVGTATYFEVLAALFAKVAE